MTWMIATIDCRSALQKSGVIKVKVVQSSPSEGINERPMATEYEIEKLLEREDYNLKKSIQAIQDEAARRQGDLGDRYIKQEIDTYMFSSLSKSNSADSIAAQDMARRLVKERKARVESESDHIAMMKKQIETLSALLEKERDMHRPISSTQQKALESNVIKPTAKERVDKIPLTPDQKLKKGLDEMLREYRTAVRGYVREACYSNASDMDYGDYDLMIHIEERLYELIEQPGWTAAQLHMIQQTINECSDIEDKEWERYRKYG